MNNPCGPYPGRQLFLGLTANNKPCFAYFVSGRSPESRQRKAISINNTVRIGPLGEVSYDPLRHYNAVKYDNSIGVVSISNGIQTEAIFEAYRLLVNVGKEPTKDYMEKLLDGADAEPDSLHTPRIAGILIVEKNNPVFIIGIKVFGVSAVTYQVLTAVGFMTGISTYSGNLDNPVPTDPSAILPVIAFGGNTADDLAQLVYDMSIAKYKGDDIRVCAVGGIYSDNRWGIAVVNKY